MIKKEPFIQPDPQGHVDLKLVKVQDRHTIARLLQELDFPTTRRKVLERFGKYELQWTHEEPIMLDDILVEIPDEQFESLVDLVDAVCSVIRLAYGDYSASNDAIIIEE